MIFKVYKKTNKNVLHKFFFLYIKLINVLYDKCDKLHYFLYSCTNAIFGKIFVSEIWAKMFSPNQILGPFN